MFVYRLASGLVFLAGGALSKLGVSAESWPLVALGLIAATLGLWHFFMGATAATPRDRRLRRHPVPEPANADPAEPRHS